MYIYILFKNHPVMCFLKTNNEVIYLYSYFFPIENL